MSDDTPNGIPVQLKRRYDNPFKDPDESAIIEDLQVRLMFMEATLSNRIAALEERLKALEGDGK